jgi:hypothetical protein
MVYLFVVYLLRWQPTDSSDFAAILIGLGLAIVLAWQAVVRDWGWKQSR